MVPFGAHWRVVVSGSPLSRHFIWPVGLRRRDCRGLWFWGGSTDRGRLGGGEVVDNARAGLYFL